MVRAVLAEPGQPVQRLVEKVLSMAGHSVIHAASLAAMWQHIASTSTPCVILVGDRLVAWRDDIVHDTLHAIELEPVRHAIIVLSATPESMAPPTRMLLRRASMRRVRSRMVHDRTPELGFGKVQRTQMP